MIHDNMSMDKFITDILNIELDHIQDLVSINSKLDDSIIIKLRLKSSLDNCLVLCQYFGQPKFLDLLNNTIQPPNSRPPIMGDYETMPKS